MTESIATAVLDYSALLNRGATDRSPARGAEMILSQSAYLPLRSLWCDDRDGVLVLRGKVPTQFLRLLAESLASRAQGVNQIDNQVKVVQLGSGRSQGPRRIATETPLRPSRFGIPSCTPKIH